MFDPALDGVDHINVYSQGKTKLGRMLSNFTKTPFVCEDGKFESIEGYWYWLGTPEDTPGRDRLRKLFGFSAKKVGRELRAEDWPAVRGFKRKIKLALIAKLDYHPAILDALVKSELPLVHYYVYAGKVVEPEDGKWLWAFLEKIRNACATDST